MNQQHLKSLMLRDKEFLKELYSSDNSNRSKKNLQNASDAKLNTLVRLIHVISNGEIRVKKKDFEVLSSRHLNHIKRVFEKKSSYQAILAQERAAKLKALMKLISVFSALLSPLFNLT